MPYIDVEYRKDINYWLQLLVDYLIELSINYNKPSGILNYVITTMCIKFIKPKSYDDYNKIIGVLECVKLEMYRRAVSKYEDEAIAKNGDIEVYK